MSNDENAISKVIVDAETGLRVWAKVELAPTSLDFTADISFEEWQNVFERVQFMGGAVQWWAGDCLLYGERHFGDRCYQYVEETTGFAHETVRAYAWIAERMPPVTRVTQLPFSHHREVACLEVADQIVFLDKALQEKWTVKELRKAIREFKNAARFIELPLPAGLFQCIEADPPWALDCAEAKSAIGQYQVMTMDRLSAMAPAILERAAEDCHLWLWAINPMLPEALRLLEAWGFTYKACLTWVKTNGFGTGHYLRGATEHCLLGIRGTLFCLRHDQRTYFEAVRGEHSVKPDAFYEIVESLSPGPRLRLFARKERDGWESWGNEL